MNKNKPDRPALLRAIEGLAAYPAMLLPTAEGGFEVIFPNLPRAKAYGADRDVALANGVEALTAELGLAVAAGETPPRPSKPARLVADDDEPAGAELLLLSPDKQTLRRRLGLVKGEGSLELGLGRLGRGK